jgi:hypothetical protein
MDRPPRRHEAGASVKAGTAAALITDHERKAVSIRVPYFHVLDATDDADELHGRSIHGASPIREAPKPEDRPILSRGGAVDGKRSPADFPNLGELFFNQISDSVSVGLITRTENRPHSLAGIRLLPGRRGRG